MIDVKIKFLNEDAKMPYKKNRTSFCYDLYASTDALPVYDDEGNVIKGVVRYGTGLAFEIDRDSVEVDSDDVLLCLDARPRWSVYKTGLSLCNCLAAVDEEYRGEVFVYFYDVVPELPKYRKGDRIVQINLSSTESLDFIPCDELSETDRGDGGFGHSGLR